MELGTPQKKGEKIMKKKKKRKCCYCEKPIEEGHVGFHNIETKKRFCAVCFSNCLAGVMGALLFPTDKRFVYEKQQP